MIISFSSIGNSSFSFFTVTAHDGHAVLRWAASTVKAEDYFIVEKSKMQSF